MRRSYPWVGERIDQVLRAEPGGSIDRAFHYHRGSNRRRIASQEPIEACRAR
jgi:hypothetical protein